MTIRAGVLVSKLVPENWLLVVLLATVLKGLVWSAAIPEGQGPDEPSHVALVQFIAEQHRLPQRADTYRADELLYLRRLSQADVIEGQRNAQQEFSDTQLGPSEARILALPPELRNSFESRSYVSAMFVPPLYHWFASLPYRLAYSASVLDRVFAMRLASVVLSAGLVWVSYWIARESFPEDPQLRRTVPIVVSFHPMITFMGAVVNSDILLFLLLGIATWLIVRALRHQFSSRIAAGLGLVTGLGILTKPMILSYGLGLALVLLILRFRKRQSWSSLVLHSLLLPGLTLLVAGWFVVRSASVQGAPLYDNPYDNPHVLARWDPQPELTVSEYWRDRFGDQLKNITFKSYWGYFGWLDTPMPGGVYDVLRWASRLAWLQMGLFFVITLRRRPVDWTTLSVLVILTVLSASPLLPMFARAYTIARDTGLHGTSAQGRYLLAMWTSQATLLVFGLTAVLSLEARKLVHGLIACSAIALNIVAFAVALIPRYYL